MAKLAWDVITDRVYETGIDRGVLYPLTGNGVAWNGLKAVRETPSGGTPAAYYVDGVKTRQRSAPEESGLVIEAITYPDEFAACDGTAWSNGLGFTLQPRKQFGFSYRTKVGNMLNADLGYKIHLIYNALAAPTERANNTLSATTEPMPFSWTVSTVPFKLAGMAPTAHIIIDSRKVSADFLKLLENRLYGTGTTAPTLPTPKQISDLFAVWNSSSALTFKGTLPQLALSTVTNLATNPSFQSTDATVILRQNIATNPNATTVTPGMTSNNAGIYPITMGVAISGHPQGITTAAKSNMVAGHAATTTILSVYNMDNQGNTGSPARYIGAWFFTNAAGYQAGFAHDPASLTALPQNTWVFVNSAIQVAAGQYVIASISKISGNVTNDADYGMVTGITAITARPPVEAIWGSRPAGDDKTYRWLGTVNGSSSVQEVVSVLNVTDSGARTFQSAAWTGTRAKSLRISSTTVGSATSSAIVGAMAAGPYMVTLVAGATYVVMATRRLLAPLTGVTDVNYQRILATYSGTTKPNELGDLLPNVAGTVNTTFTFTVPSDANAAALRLGHGGSSDSGDVWWDNLVITRKTDYTGRTYDGGTAPFIYQKQTVTPKWDTPAGADVSSTSSISYYPNLPQTPADGDAYIMGTNLWVYNATSGVWVNWGWFDLPT